MTETIDWSVLDKPMDDMLAKRIPTRKCADLLGVSTATLRRRMRARGISLPPGRIVGTPLTPDHREKIVQGLKGRWERYYAAQRAQQEQRA